MPIKNYTTIIPAEQSIAELTKALVKNGALRFMTEYEQGTGFIDAVKFTLPLRRGEVAFRLPIQWRKFQEVLKQQRVARWKDDAYCYRVAWRCVRDWVLAQMALYETQMVDLPQVFLPYAMQGDRTLYEYATENLLLGAPDQGAA